MLTIRDGTNKSVIDNNDISFNAILNSYKPIIEEKIDYRKNIKHVRNQGSQLTSAAFAVTSTFEMLYNIKFKSNILLSPAFIYYFTCLEKNYPIESGIDVKSALETWKKYGCCFERDFPYNQNGIIYPNKNTINLAQFKIRNYYKANSLEEIQAALCLKMGVILVSNTKVFGMAQEKTKFHAVSVVGYDNVDNHLIIKNSWGKFWGNKGFRFIPYEQVLSEKNYVEFWVMET